MRRVSQNHSSALVGFMHSLVSQPCFAWRVKEARYVLTILALKRIAPPPPPTPRAGLRFFIAQSAPKTRFGHRVGGGKPVSPASYFSTVSDCHF